MKRTGAAWSRFWFEPRSVAPVALVRIAFGLVVTAWTLSLAPDLNAFLSRTGVVPVQPSHPFWIGLLSPAAPAWLVYLVWAGLLISAIALTVGYHSRIASVLVFVGIISIERRDPFIFNAGDLLLRNIAIILMAAPAGAAFSVDRWRAARDRFWDFEQRSRWALRLLQVQLAIIYAATVWAKFHGTTWRNGTAVSFALRLEQYQRFAMPTSISTSRFLAHVMTYGALAIEIAIPILVWNRRTRPWVLAAGAIMHIAIAINIMIGFFTTAMLVSYLAFVPPETAERVLRRLARAVPTLRRSGVPAAQPSRW